MGLTFHLGYRVELPKWSVPQILWLNGLSLYSISLGWERNYPITTYVQQESLGDALDHFNLPIITHFPTLGDGNAIMVCHGAARLAEARLAGADWALVVLPTPLLPPPHCPYYPTTPPSLLQPPPLYNPYYNLQLHCPLLILRPCRRSAGRHLPHRDSNGKLGNVHSISSVLPPNLTFDTVKRKFMNIFFKT